MGLLEEFSGFYSPELGLGTIAILAAGLGFVIVALLRRFETRLPKNDGGT